MIAVRMGENEGVDRVNTMPQQKRHHDALAHAFGNRIFTARTAFESPSRIHEQGVAAWSLYDDRIRLSDVEHGDAQPRVVEARRPEHERDRQRQRCNRECLAIAFP